MLNDSLSTLEKAVAQRSNWRILTKGTANEQRFVIEKQVRYNFVRGFSMYATHRITGNFQQTLGRETRLHYEISGQSGIAILHAAFYIGILLIFTVLLGSVVFHPQMVNQWVGVLLLVILIIVTIAYGLYAYRSYQAQIKELQQFMEEFTQSLGGRS